MAQTIDTVILSTIHNILKLSRNPTNNLVTWRKPRAETGAENCLKMRRIAQHPSNQHTYLKPPI